MDHSRYLLTGQYGHPNSTSLKDQYAHQKKKPHQADERNDPTPTVRT